MSMPPNDPAAPSPPSPTPEGRGAKFVVLGVLALLAIAGIWYVAKLVPAPAPDPSGGDIQLQLAEAAKQFQGRLPQEMQKGVIFEQVLVEGTSLVMVIRATGLTAAQARSKPEAFELARQQEIAAMRGACRDPGVRQLLDKGIGIVRRFVDAKGEKLFDVGITAAQCAQPTP